jgi:hypothetical protein
LQTQECFRVGERTVKIRFEQQTIGCVESTRQLWRRIPTSVQRLRATSDCSIAAPSTLQTTSNTTTKNRWLTCDWNKRKPTQKNHNRNTRAARADTQPICAMKMLNQRSWKSTKTNKKEKLIDNLVSTRHIADDERVSSRCLFDVRYRSVKWRLYTHTHTEREREREILHCFDKNKSYQRR